MYLSATNPHWFQPYQEAAVTTLSKSLPMDFATACVLLRGTPSSAVTALVDRVAADPQDRLAVDLLAATGDEEGLLALADIARLREIPGLNELGVHVGATGPAVWRFSPRLYAVVVPGESPPGQNPDGTVSLPLSEVAADPDGSITWHYLSLRPDRIVGAPTWPFPLAHLVSPRTYWYELQGEVDAVGRYVRPHVEVEHGAFDTGMAEAELDRPSPVSASLRQLDADLLYCNGHVHLTPSVVGHAGGPPIGLYPNPVCSGCDVLMFHLTSVRADFDPAEYGDGFRSLFVCETCVRVASRGTGWN